MLGQRRSASPSFSGRSSVPHAGQCVGIANARSEPSRRSTTGPMISGITSPALRSTTVSPMSTPLRTTSLALCSVAISTVDPATLTGSMTAYGVTLPVRPASDSDVEELGGDLFGWVLVGDRPARRARRRAELVLNCPLVQLHDDAVDLVLDRMPALAEVLDIGPDLIEVPRQLAVRADRQSPAIHGCVRVGQPIGGEAFKNADAVADEAEIPRGSDSGSFCRSEPAAALRDWRRVPCRPAPGTR